MSPRRRPLAHTPPDFIPDGALFFLTICGQPRGANQFAKPEVWARLRSAAVHYHTHHRWHVRLLLVMPDHLHALASVRNAESLQRVVAAWKHFTCRVGGISWQRDFFDHRLRSHESLAEKAGYIRANPVRAGLVSALEDWPYVWSPDTIATPW